MDQTLDLRAQLNSPGYKVLTAGTDWVATGAGVNTVHIKDFNFRSIDAGSGNDCLVLDNC